MVQTCDEDRARFRLKGSFETLAVSVYVCDCRISYGHVTVVKASDSMGLCRYTSEGLTVREPMVQASDWR